jgi:hypothetical protein
MATAKDPNSANQHATLETKLFVTGGICLLLALGVFSSKPQSAETKQEAKTCQTADDCMPDSAGSLFSCIDYNEAGIGTCTPGLPRPLPKRAWLVAAMGQPGFAAAIIWLRIVQFIGQTKTERLQYLGLENWLNLITDLTPKFRIPYLYGGILLATTPKRAESADRLLRKAENVFVKPSENKWEFYLWRAFVAYYGKLSPKEAIPLYQKCYESGGPTYLKHLVKRLESESMTCENLFRNLRLSQESIADATAKSLLGSQTDKVMTHCYKTKINHAATSFFLNTGKYPDSISTLVEANLISELPPKIPGQCWSLFRDRVVLQPCKRTTR